MPTCASRRARTALPVTCGASGAAARGNGAGATRTRAASNPARPALCLRQAQIIGQRSPQGLLIAGGDAQPVNKLGACPGIPVDQLCKRRFFARRLRAAPSASDKAARADASAVWASCGRFRFRRMQHRCARPVLRSHACHHRPRTAAVALSKACDASACAALRALGLSRARASWSVASDSARSTLCASADNLSKLLGGRAMVCL